LVKTVHRTVFILQAPVKGEEIKREVSVKDEENGKFKIKKEGFPPRFTLG